MRRFSRLRSFFSAIAFRRRIDRDMELEWQFHLESRTESLMASGMSRGAAERQARTEFGDQLRWKEEGREARGLRVLDELRGDLVYAVRQLRHAPGQAAVIITTLAIGIGVNSAIFSLADAALLHPLPVSDPGAIITVSAASADDRRVGFSYPNYRDLQEQSRSLDGLIAYQRPLLSFARSPQAAHEMRMGMLVSGNFFHVLGLQASRGRVFTPDEAIVPGRDAVVVLGYDFWKNNLASDPSIVNQVVWINSVDFTVVGVAPERFTGVEPYIRPALYVPITMAERLKATQDRPLDDRAARTLRLKGRLKPGMSRRAAQAELTTIWSALERQYPEANRNRTLAVLTEIQSRFQSDSITAIAMTMLMTLVALVLIIACANVASLMLGRARVRSREMAIRLALGVGRLRLFRQLITESLVLAGIGAGLGLAIAYGAIRSFQRFQIPTDLPVAIDPQMNYRMLLFSLMAAAGSAVGFGLAPALLTLKTRLVPALKSGESDRPTRHRTIGPNVLVVGQVALSMVLLIATAMLLDGFRTSLTINPGFRTDHLMMMSLDTSFVRYSPVQTREFYRQLVERARTLPGVASVALTSAIPLDVGGEIRTAIPEGYQPPPGEPRVSVFTAVVDEHYFSTMRTPIVRGRAFSANDNNRSRPVAIVNEEFANTYWPGQDPVGKRLRLNDGAAPWLEVVGVTQTGRYLFIGEAPMRFLYLPYAQHERSLMSLLVETDNSDAASIAAPLREVVRALDVTQPIFNLRTFSSFYEQRAIAVARVMAQMVGAMGVIGLMLALVGLYGLVAYSVTRRTREIGIRVAIGARRADVMKMVLRQGLALSLTGILIGAAVSVPVAHLLTAAMAGIITPNAANYIVVPVALIVLTLAASYFPARRASLVDPLLALRYE
jgi:predicted permease